MAKVISRMIIQEKYKERRLRSFPETKEEELWSNDWKHKKTGFAPIPRTFAIICKIIDELSEKQPLSKVFLSLWLRNFGTSFVVIKDLKEITYESGLKPNTKGLSSFKYKLKKLQALNFIKIKETLYKDQKEILILNPYRVIERHKEKIKPDLYQFLQDRMRAVGADDFKEEEKIN